MKFGFVIVFCSIYLSSCKKEEKLLPEHFIGTWDWQYTFAYHYNEQGQVFKIDTLRPNSGVWGIDFDCHFEVKKNGDVHLFENNQFYLKLKSKQLIYSFDADPNRRSYQPTDDFFEDRGLFTRIYMEGHILSNYAGVWSFPIGGRFANGMESFGNEVSIINHNGRVGVYNVFKRR